MLLSFAMQPAFFGAAGDNVADGGDGVEVEHARGAVAHDGANGFAHFRFVAVDAAVGAEGFCFHKRAVVAALGGVARQPRAVCAERALRCAVVAVAVEGDHLAHHRFFTRTFFDEIRHGGSSFGRRFLLSV